jgi:hypothetical protein
MEYVPRSKPSLKERNPHPVSLVCTNRVTKKLTMTDLARTFDALRPFGVHIITFRDISQRTTRGKANVGGDLVPERDPGWKHNIFIFISSLNIRSIYIQRGRPCCSVTKTCTVVGTYSTRHLYRFFPVVCPLTANQIFFFLPPITNRMRILIHHRIWRSPGSGLRLITLNLEFTSSPEIALSE